MPPVVLQPPFDLEAIPDRPAVFLIAPRNGRPYLARTAVLRRRLNRLLQPREGFSRFLNLHDVAASVEYHLTTSRLGAALTYYDLARHYFPDDYATLIKLRLAPFVKVLLANTYPRTTITTRLSGAQSFQFGPFRTRASAERFEQEVLDLFQVRRCQDDLAVSPDHPGCIYGEMARCLRPCQEIVGPEEYRSEVTRLVHFLESGGQSLLEPVARARDRSSEELDFENALQQHQRYQRIEQVLRLRDDLVHDVDRLCGITVAPSSQPGCVELLMMIQGTWLAPVEFRVAATGRETIPLDRRLRELFTTLEIPRATLRDRAEHIALLARWFYSSWRDTDWIDFARLDDLPYRRVVRAISKTASAVQTNLFES